MRLTKIYTKVGDKGSTRLADGTRVRKDDCRIEAYGTVDELNSQIGLLRDFITECIAHQDIDASLQRIQNELFDIGGELATPQESLNLDRQQVVQEDEIKRLEDEIDNMNAMIPPLENFILPGGHRANSQAHICRCICRRAERRVVAFGKEQKMRPEVQTYLNRLSDWLFVVSRMISKELQVAENLWQQNRR